MQGLEKLCNPSPPSTSYQSTPPPSTPWSALRSLFLGYNPLGPDSGPALSTLLSLTSGLLQLGLQSCGLGERALERHTGLGQTLKGSETADHASVRFMRCDKKLCSVCVVMS